MYSDESYNDYWDINGMSPVNFYRLEFYEYTGDALERKTKFNKLMSSDDILDTLEFIKKLPSIEN